MRSTHKQIQRLLSTKLGGTRRVMYQVRDRTAKALRSGGEMRQ